MLSGIGGPGAPHHFEISRREDLGLSISCKQAQLKVKLGSVFDCASGVCPFCFFNWKCVSVVTQGSAADSASDPYWKLEDAEKLPSDIIVR